jgi:hypothetical protein
LCSKIKINNYFCKVVFHSCLFVGTLARIRRAKVFKNMKKTAKQNAFKINQLFLSSIDVVFKLIEIKKDGTYILKCVKTKEGSYYKLNDCINSDATFLNHVISNNSWKIIEKI